MTTHDNIPLSICILIPGFGDGGAQKQCIRTINEMSRMFQIPIDVIYFFEGVHFSLLATENIRLHRISVRSNYNPINIVRIHRIIKRLKPDVLMTWLHSCDVYGAFLKGASPSVSWVMTERDSYYPPDIRYWLRRRLGRYADLIIANSAAGQRYWLRSLPHAEVLVIPNIIEEVTPIQPLVSTETLDVLYVGRLEEQKNIETVVSAFCALAERRPDLKFGVVGDGAQRIQLIEAVSRRQLCPQISFLGFRQDAVQLIRNARVLVSLSHHEGAPNVVLEALSAGTSVVASDIPEHRDLLGEDYSLYVSDRMSSGLAANTIEMALENEDNEAALRHGRARIKEMSGQAVACRYHAALCDVVNSRQRRLASSEVIG